jgi:hypothetical protein
MGRAGNDGVDDGGSTGVAKRAGTGRKGSTGGDHIIDHDRDALWWDPGGIGIAGIALAGGRIKTRLRRARSHPCESAGIDGQAQACGESAGDQKSLVIAAACQAFG